MSPHQSTAENFLDKLSRITDGRLDNEQFGVSELAHEMGMSRSNLHRKVKAVTGKSVSQFIREIRLKKAFELLKQSESTVSEVAYRVGFGSATYFSKCFHDYFGFSPGDTDNRTFTENPPLASRATPPEGDKNKRRSPASRLHTTIVVILSATILVIVLKPFARDNNSGVKSIVILPFRNDSPDDSNDYIVNSMLEEIINKLTFLEDLSVVSRTTSEVYRGSNKSLKEIGKELHVDYILEGSATIINNNTRIRLQLIEPIADRQLWSRPYEREIDLENIFQVQEEVALAVAEELKLLLKPAEKEQIERKPTENLVAYNAYMLARELLNVLSTLGDQASESSGTNAKVLLEEAIELDSTFSEAYTWLGHIYINMLYFQAIWGDPEAAYAIMDTGLHYVNKALSYNRSHGISLILKGTYYQRNGKHREAEKIKLEASRNATEPYLAYFSDCSWYIPYNQYYHGINGYLKYIELKPGHTPVPRWVHDNMYVAFKETGFPELSRYHLVQILRMDGDSIGYYRKMRDLEMSLGNYITAVDYGVRLNSLDINLAWYGALIGKSYIYLNELDSVVRWIRPLMDECEQKATEAEPNCTAAYVFQRLGNKEMADLLLEKDLSEQKKKLDYPTPEVQCGYVHLHLARIYSILGDPDKTMEYLENLKDLAAIDIGMINELKDWPSYEIVRDTPQFKEILTNMETAFREEHNKIATLLREKGMITP